MALPAKNTQPQKKKKKKHRIHSFSLSGIDQISEKEIETRLEQQTLACFFDLDKVPAPSSKKGIIINSLYLVALLIMSIVK